MGCNDFELDLSMAPSHASKIGSELGLCEGVRFSIDDYGLKVHDEFNSATPIGKYVSDLAKFAGVPKPKIEGMARENLVVGFVGAVMAKDLTGERNG
jgi:hypothetical protein